MIEVLDVMRLTDQRGRTTHLNFTTDADLDRDYELKYPLYEVLQALNHLRATDDRVPVEMTINDIVDYPPLAELVLTTLMVENSHIHDDTEQLDLKKEINDIKGVHLKTTSEIEFWVRVAIRVALALFVAFSLGQSLGA